MTLSMIQKFKGLQLLPQVQPTTYADAAKQVADLCLKTQVVSWQAVSPCQIKSLHLPFSQGSIIVRVALRRMAVLA